MICQLPGPLSCLWWRLTIDVEGRAQEQAQHVITPHQSVFPTTALCGSEAPESRIGLSVAQYFFILTFLIACWPWKLLNAQCPMARDSSPDCQVKRYPLCFKPLSCELLLFSFPPPSWHWTRQWTAHPYSPFLCQLWFYTFCSHQHLVNSFMAQEV